MGIGNYLFCFQNFHFWIGRNQGGLKRLPVRPGIFFSWGVFLNARYGSKYNNLRCLPVIYFCKNSWYKKNCIPAAYLDYFTFRLNLWHNHYRYFIPQYLDARLITTNNRTLWLYPGRSLKCRNYSTKCRIISPNSNAMKDRPVFGN